MKESCLVYSYTNDCDMCKNQVEIPKESLLKFVKNVCLPMFKYSQVQTAGNESGYFSKSYLAKNYEGYVFDRSNEFYADFALFVCGNDGDFYIHFSFGDSNTFYEIPICWRLNEKQEIVFEYYDEEVEADV